MTDHDSPQTIIEAVREWQEADAASTGLWLSKEGVKTKVLWEGEERFSVAENALRALRLPPEEARNDD